MGIAMTKAYHRQFDAVVRSVQSSPAFAHHSHTDTKFIQLRREKHWECGLLCRVFFGKTRPESSVKGIWRPMILLRRVLAEKYLSDGTIVLITPVTYETF